MSRKMSIDRFFREIAKKHREPFRKQDWEAMHELLQAEGLSKPSEISYGQRHKFVLRTFTSVAALFLCLIPTYLLREDTSLNKQAIVWEEQSINTEGPKVATPQNVENNNSELNPEVLSSEEYSSTSFPQNVDKSKAQVLSLPTLSKEDKKLSPDPSKKSLSPVRIAQTERIPNANQRKKAAPSSEMIFPKPLHTFAYTELEPRPDLSVLKILNSQPVSYGIPSGIRGLGRGEAQFGLFPPLTSQGLLGERQRAKLSLHLISGKSYSNHGFALAGLSNRSDSANAGLQISGGVNKVQGIQSGVQMGGLANQAGSFERGLQIAGLINISDLQEPSSDLDKPKVKNTFQIAGVSNMSPHGELNAQVAGLSNSASTIKGLQVASVLNKTQVVKGAQISAGVNVARKVEGVQIGLINVADSVDGVQIGLFSYVKSDPYIRLEFWGSEALHSNIGLKVGRQQFYNIFAMGSQIEQNRFRWAIGYGFGTETRFNPSTFLNTDLIAFHVNEDRGFTKQLNLLTTLKFSLGKRFGKRFAIFGGPSINTLFSDFRNENNQIGSRIAPWIIFQDFTGGTKVQMWVGFNLGLKL